MQITLLQVAAAGITDYSDAGKGKLSLQVRGGLGIPALAWKRRTIESGRFEEGVLGH